MRGGKLARYTLVALLFLSVFITLASNPVPFQEAASSITTSAAQLPSFPKHLDFGSFQKTWDETLAYVEALGREGVHWYANFGWMNSIIQPVQATSTFGDTTAEASNSGAGYIVCDSYTFAGGTISSMSFYSNTTGASAKVGIYDDSAGAPHNLLLTEVQGTGNVGWITVTYNTGNVATQTLWLCDAVGALGSVTFKNDTGKGKYISHTYASAWPSPFGASSTANETDSVYATYSSGGVTNSATITQSITGSPTVSRSYAAKRSDTGTITTNPLVSRIYSALRSNPLTETTVASVSRILRALRTNSLTEILTIILTKSIPRTLTQSFTTNPLVSRVYSALRVQTLVESTTLTLSRVLSAYRTNSLIETLAVSLSGSVTRAANLNLTITTTPALTRLLSALRVNVLVETTTTSVSRFLQTLRSFSLTETTNTTLTQLRKLARSVIQPETLALTLTRVTTYYRTLLPTQTFTTGYTNAATFTNDASQAGAAWTNPSNAQTINQQYSTAILPTITRVQGNARGVWSSGSSFTVTLANAPTDGNSLVMTMSGANTGGLIIISNVSETGATWTKQTSQSLSEPASYYLETEIWVASNVSGAGTTITINLSGTPNKYQTANICEYSGLTNSGVLDKTASGSGGPATTSDSGTTATTSQTNELWVASIATNIAPQSSPTNSFTLLDGTALATPTNAYLEKLVGSIGAANTGTTMTNDYYVGVIATFKGAATSQYLKATNFAFSLPSYGTVDGVQVQVVRNGTNSVVSDLHMYLVKGGTIGSSDRALAGTWGADATITYGTATDLWGWALAPSDVNASNFGVVFAAQFSGSGTASVDAVTMTISYHYATQILTITGSVLGGLIHNKTVSFLVTTSPVLSRIFAGTRSVTLNEFTTLTLTRQQAFYRTIAFTLTTSLSLIVFVPLGQVVLNIVGGGGNPIFITNQVAANGISFFGEPAIPLSTLTSLSTLLFILFAGISFGIIAGERDRRRRKERERELAQEGVEPILF